MIGEDGLGNPGPGLGTRATPSFPTPNSEPTGYLTGAPVRTRFYSTSVAPVSSRGQTHIVPGVPNNRVVILTAPLVGFRIYIGESGVTPANGLALPPGLAYEVLLPGLQDLYAVTDAPVYLTVQVQVASVLLAERQRRVG